MKDEINLENIIETIDSFPLGIQDILRESGKNGESRGRFKRKTGIQQTDAAVFTFYVKSVAMQVDMSCMEVVFTLETVDNAPDTKFNSSFLGRWPVEI